MSNSTDPDRFHIIDRQIRLWESRRAAERESPEAPPAPGPWITVSRESGSSGGALGALVASELGWQVFDREILQAVAKEVHVKDQILAHFDEHLRDGFEDYLRTMAVPEDPGQSVFLREMLKVLLAAGRRGRIVLVGRGANWVLDPAYGLRVRVVAPLEARILAVQERDGVSRADARRRIQEQDAFRADFVRRVFRQEVDDPAGYDLVVNTASLGLPAAARVVVRALEEKLGTPRSAW